MRRAILLFGILFLAMTLALWSDATAGTLGKIVGKVLDDKGQPLPGANVIVEGTSRGATTDSEGYYVILRVDPGLYTMTASMVGYQKESKTETRVQADVTAQVDFTLKETTLELGEMVVRAERPAVEVDKTFTKYTVGADEIEQVPLVRTTNEVVSLQPGVWVDGSNRIRGSVNADRGANRNSTGGDVAYYVDGVRLVNSDGAGSRLWTSVNKSAVQEITVVTGGMNAEYGNAQAGVISVVTKDGGQSYHGWTEYTLTPAGKKHWGENAYESPLHRNHMKWGDSEWENERDPLTGRILHQREDYTNVTGHEIEGNLSGPVTRKASFMVTAKTTKRASVYPDASSRGFSSDTGGFVPAPNNFRGSYSVSTHPSDNVKLKVGGMVEYYNQYNTSSFLTSTAMTRGLGDNGKNIFLPEDWSASGKESTLQNMTYLGITHSLSAKTFYDFRISWYTTRDDTSGVPVTTTDVRRDADGWFAVDRSVRRSETRKRNRLQMKFDLASQMSKSHFVKAGFEMIKYDLWWTRLTQDQPGGTHFEYVGGEAVIGKSVRPLHIAVYAQDKMEFEGMVINAGVRLDRFDPVTKTFALAAYSLAPMYDTPQRLQNAPMKTPKVNVNISPRIGVSHPITDRSSVHFFSGLFLAYPDIHYLYSTEWRSTGNDIDWNENGAIDANEQYNSFFPPYPVKGYFGSVDIRPEKTISFEVGLDWNFIKEYVVSMATFYKSSKDQYFRASDMRFYAPSRPGWAHSYNHAVRNNGFDEQRGLELSLRKPLSRNFSFSLSYNMTWAQYSYGTRDGCMVQSYPDSEYVASGRYWYKFDIVNGQEVPVPLTVDEIEAFGNRANQQIRKIKLRDQGRRAGPGYWYMDKTLEELGFEAIDAFEVQHLIPRVRGQLRSLAPDGGDVRNMASFQVLYATPGAYGPAVNLFGSPLLANWRANLIWRMQNTGGFTYNPPEGGQQRRQRPVRTWTDMAIEKQFPMRGGRGNVSFFLEVRNLFNQADDSSYPTQDYVSWGLLTSRPDNSDFVNYGDVNDRSYRGSPRYMQMGLRANF